MGQTHVLDLSRYQTRVHDNSDQMKTDTKFPRDLVFTFLARCWPMTNLSSPRQISLGVGNRRPRLEPPQSPLSSAPSFPSKPSPPGAATLTTSILPMASAPAEATGASPGWRQISGGSPPSEPPALWSATASRTGAAARGTWLCSCCCCCCWRRKRVQGRRRAPGLLPPCCFCSAARPAWMRRAAESAAAAARERTAADMEEWGWWFRVGKGGWTGGVE